MSITRGIVGCWSPSLGATGYLLRDVSGQNNHGTIQNWSSGVWQPETFNGNSGQKMFLNGSSQCLTNRQPTLETASGQAGKAFTVCVWFMSTGRLDAFRTIWSTAVNNPGNTPVFEFGIRNTNVVYFYGRQPDFLSIESIPISLNTRYFLALGIEAGGSGTVWAGINGAFASVGTTSANDGRTCTDEFIGVDGTINSNDFSYFQGYIGETTAFNRLLTAAEVREIYRRGEGYFGRQLTGMNQRRAYAKRLGNRRRRLLCGGMT